MSAFALSADPILPGELRASLEDPAAGAVVCFEGVVRNHNAGREVLKLAYQSYEQLALAEGERILAEAHARFGLARIRCVHRVGELAIGDVAVWVGASAAHRDAAYAANRYVIDEVKRRVPIWKKEFYRDGESEWLHPGEGQEPPDIDRG